VTSQVSDARTSPHVPICAIGASAGGVGALRGLFRQLPDNLGLSYVVILHMSPEHPSALAQILASCTKMDVVQVDDHCRLKPDCVFVIPPDRELVIEGDNVTAREFTEPRGRRAPIDRFFRSVAQARGDGMAVVLSGSGMDGSNGLRAIHEGGGVIFAQEPAEAEFPPMPQNAIATGLVNFIAPIPRLAERMAEVARSKEAVRSLDVDGAANDLRKIVAHLRTRTGHDFSSYKRATVMRRVLRRMQVCRIDKLEDYGEYLRTTPEEAQELFADLLISVTHFFRDPAAFDALARQVIAPLVADAGPDGIRVWVAGCATGEEAYSLAILFLEEMERAQTRVQVQIFASDLDEGALRTGREGRYPQTIEADVSEERLRRFFVEEGTHVRVRKEVRDLVMFASHSVLKDPPFLRLDLISCRNLLIYLDRFLQGQLLRLFHYGLKPNGHLFLGSAETADTKGDHFITLDGEARIYSAVAHHRKQLPVLSSHLSDAPAVLRDQTVDRQATQPAPAAATHARALEETAPPSILVDDGQRIIHLSASAGKYILHPEGTYSAKLSVVVRPELRLDVRVGLDRALGARQASMSYPLPVSFGDGLRRVAIQVSPVATPGSTAMHALVLFLEAGPSSAEDLEAVGNGVPEEETRRLLADLRAAQEALVASRSEHDLAMEDLRAANEELQSINEEYRSTSEELETSKEELQSLNEELQTVNSELKAKLDSISTSHSDLQNLTSATEIGTLFLDAKLRIRMFTPPMAELFNITDMDVGRAITDFTHRLKYDSVEADATKVLRELVPAESEVQSRDGRWFMMRLRPYRTVEDRIDGVVLTFVDVTARRETEQELTDSRERYELLFNSIDEGFCLIDVIFDEQDRPVDYRFVDVNAAFGRQTGLSSAIGSTIRELVPGHEGHWYEIYGRIARTKTPERFEARAAAMGRFYEAYGFPVAGNHGNRVGVLFRDVTERQRANEERDMLTHELSHRVKNTLAVVQALVRQSGGKDLTVETYRDGLIGRLQALSRAHDQLLRTNWQSADLRILVDATLSPYGRLGQSNIVIDGEAVLLSPKQSLGLSLVLHELATNASKYGSLSTREGQLSVDWSVEQAAQGPELKFCWQETGGPEMPALMSESRKGFGMELIERASVYELGGSSVLRFRPDGLVVEIRFPLALGGI
jgi:two-component system, chemotaxis family, CheB/CheR fusion protein